ncbi:MAG: glycosyltransferase family 2 protein [Nitrospirota bacterium]
MKKLISIVTPCFNEEENVREVYRQVKHVFDTIEGYTYEHIFIDNASTDRTVEILKEIAQTDLRIKIIVNTRNFGIARSPYYALLQTRGDAVIVVMADLQDPPHMIKDFIKKWEAGYRIVLAVKEKTEESRIMSAIRKLYYHIYNKLAEVEIVRNYCGFGLYDRKIIEILREFDDPYPDLRSQLAEMGFERAILTYTQPARKRGITKNNFYALYEQAMLGITSHSKVPLRLATMTGFVIAGVSLLVGMGYFVYKLVFWDRFSVGIAPLVIGLFFFSAVQLIFIGIAGEYIGFIYTQILKRPLVIEKERINFD